MADGFELKLSLGNTAQALCRHSNIEKISDELKEVSDTQTMSDENFYISMTFSSMNKLKATCVRLISFLSLRDTTKRDDV